MVVSQNQGDSPFFIIVVNNESNRFTRLNEREKGEKEKKKEEERKERNKSYKSRTKMKYSHGNNTSNNHKSK